MNKRIVGWLAGVLYAFLIFPLVASPPQQIDTLKILAIRVEFQPDNAGTTTGDGTFNLTAGTTPFQIDPPPHNRRYFQDHLRFAQNYFAKASRGKVVVSGDVFPEEENAAYRLDLPMTDYNPNTSAEAINQGVARLLRDAIEKADADPAIDFSRYNTVIVFHAGVGRDIDVGLDETPQDIPSLFVTSGFLQQHLDVDGIPVDGGATVVQSGIILPETESQEGIQLGLNGILVSNLGSRLGLPDLFSPDTRRTGVGRFALMDAGLFNGDGLLPALPMAWSRMAMGWEAPQTIYQAQGDVFEVRHVLAATGPRIYKVPINEREYFLLENRYAGSRSIDSLQAVLIDQRNELVSMREILETFFPDAAVFSAETGVLIDIDNPDRGLPGSGALIWHIDENIIDAHRAANRVNADPARRGVDLEEADGSQDIGANFDLLSGGAGSELGWLLDLWYRGNTAPLFRNEFSPVTVPNSRSNVNNANSHITLKNFSGRDSVMTFEATLNIFQPNFPASYDIAQHGKPASLKTADVDFDGKAELILTTGRNQVLVFDAGGVPVWRSGSGPEAVRLPAGETLLQPPALFPIANSMALALASPAGNLWFYGFHRPSGQVDSLAHFQCPGGITTFPVWPGDGNAVFFGCADGRVLGVGFNGEVLTQVVLATIPEPVRFLQFSDDGEAIIVGNSGSVYRRDATRIAELPPDVYQPAGVQAVTATADGTFFNLSLPGEEFAESGTFRVDAPLVTLEFAPDSPRAAQSLIVAAGGNRGLVFNENFTLRSAFPVRLYQLDIPVRLSISPLVADLPGGEGNADIVWVDPGGMITASDLEGNLLPDFPLAVGDSLATSPVLLDLDGDGDLELAVVTVRGTLFAWDFPATGGSPLVPWGQQYATPGNANRPAAAVSPAEPTPVGLLPAEFAYNWPNPNTGDFTFLRYRLTEAAEVRIKIFDLAGDLVQELAGPGLANTDNEVRWDLTGVQSGVYLGRIEARGNGKSGVQIIKIAVVK